MKVGLGMFDVGGLVWILFTSLAVSLFFTQRVRRALKQQGKPLDLPRVRALFSGSEYSRSDVYGALVGGIGCTVTFVALVMLAFAKKVLR